MPEPPPTPDHDEQDAAAAAGVSERPGGVQPAGGGMQDPAVAAEVPGRPRSVRMVVLGVGVLIAALIVVFAVSERGRGSPPVPDYAPDFDGDTLDGGSFDMAVQRGRWVVVNFFSTWCVQCVVEHPELVAFQNRYRNDPDVRLVSVVFRDDVETIARFFAAQGGDWPVVVTNTGRVAIDFGVTAVPETYLVSPQGQVVSKFTGGVTSAALEAELSRYRSGV